MSTRIALCNCRRSKGPGNGLKIKHQTDFRVVETKGNDMCTWCCCYVKYVQVPDDWSPSEGVQSTEWRLNGRLHPWLTEDNIERSKKGLDVIIK